MYQDVGGARLTADTALACDKEFQAERWRSGRDEYTDTHKGHDGACWSNSINECEGED